MVYHAIDTNRRAGQSMQLVEKAVSGLYSTQMTNGFTQKYPFGLGLVPLATGVLRRRRTGDINDMGDDWWLPAHSSAGVVFMR
jgi:hypothetical protein